MDGFLNLAKSAGFTSHDCVARVRRLLKTKRVGHAGTLDPAATGVLAIALGRATRLLQFLPGEKSYRARIRLGMTTTTDDLEGEILQQQPVPPLDLDTVKAALQPFLGIIQQLPPNYSAVQVGGQRLYDLARQGKEIAVNARTVEVHQITVLDWQPGAFPELEIAITCGAGTYIRAIARDLGQVLQTGGTLAALVRTESSGFHLNDSLTLAELETIVPAATLPLIPPEIALASLEKMVLPDAIARRWCLGQRIAWDDLRDASFNPEIAAATPIQIHRESGQFIGIGQRQLRQDGYVLAPNVVYAIAEI
ncbi:MAG: tRNA pseudouridine(55) synthase TruB [Leptolyngbyaceae cyanobacterium bins.349]|nr:tRNA pseudouridine(55) synthase TruB [Leptolyngbyaceae cyanobacterium bins.349]